MLSGPSSRSYRGRFAPSPTGDLHLGSAACALLSWLCARSAGGRLVLRVEDIDRPRVQPGAESRQLDDLRWLGLDWDEGPDCGGPHAPYRQSQRTSLYDRALEQLAAHGLTYSCDCSRADIARAASAPHAGEEGPRYPGTCRQRGPSVGSWKRPPAIRLKVPDREIVVDDRWQGRVVENVWQTVGDFVLRRADGVYAYQLAVVVDDLAMGVTEVVRGADLLGSAPRQALLCQLLGQKAPSYAHHPMVVARNGSRLAKRTHGVTLRDHRVGGATPGAILALLAGAVDLAAPERTSAVATPNDLLEGFDPLRLTGRKIAVAPL